MYYVSISAELDRIGVDYEMASAAELKVLCPFHNDSNPSLYINSEKKVCKCHACGWDGSFQSYLAKKEGKLLAEVIGELQKRYGITPEHSINPVRIEQAHAKIWVFDHFIQELRKRGLDLETIKVRKLGVERNRITIPIYDDEGFIVNLRKYLPGAESSKKFRDEKKCGKTLRLYPIDQLSYDKIVICSGEVKALSTAIRTNPAGIGAISPTGGEHRWSSDLTDKLSGKHVWIAYDVDAAGVSAAEVLARQIAAYVEWCGVVKLPLNRVQWPKGGIDDFVASGGNILEVLENTPKFEIPEFQEKEYTEEPERFESLESVIHSDNVGTRITADCVITSLDLVPYSLPKTVEVSCNKGEDCCLICPIHPLKEVDMVREVHPENPVILDMVQSAASVLGEKLKEAFSIPMICKSCKFKTLKYQHAEDTRISENLDVSKHSDDKAMIPAVFVENSLKLNEPYTFEGRLLPHPKTSQAVLLCSSVKKKEDSLSTFNVKTTEHLKLFRPNEWTKEELGAKLNDIYEDLEANVTHIYSRRQMHLMIDLAYHSPLFIKFKDKYIKGWTEVLIVGDSSQGKTETAMNLQSHYGMGSSVSCKGASTAGIIGGIQQINKRWFVTWGALPMQDRGLLIFEELKGLPQEQFAKLTDVRSSGIAELIKIERRKTYARVRLVALSNPRSERPVSTYASGVEVIKELVGSLEDIRRFDSFYVVKKEDVQINEVIGLDKECNHVYTSMFCHDLVLWAWSLKDTVFEDEKHLLGKSIEFGNTYSDNVPIYDRGSGRYKIARLAAALAARTFSTEDDDLGTLVVRNCHVDYVCDFLHKIYGSDTFGYLEYSKRQRDLETIKDEDQVLQKLNQSSYPRELCESFLNSNGVSRKSIEGIGCDPEEAQDLFSFLIRKHCIRRSGQDNYFKTASFVRFLRDSLNNNEIKDRPDYIANTIGGM